MENELGLAFQEKIVRWETVFPNKIHIISTEKNHLNGNNLEDVILEEITDVDKNELQYASEKYNKSLSFSAIKIIASLNMHLPWINSDGSVNDKRSNIVDVIKILYKNDVVYELGEADYRCIMETLIGYKKFLYKLNKNLHPSKWQLESKDIKFAQKSSDLELTYEENLIVKQLLKIYMGINI